MKKIVKKKKVAKKAINPRCFVCKGTGKHKTSQIVFGIPGYIVKEVNCPMGCGQQLKR
jgi:hypothetical protein